MEIIRLNKMCIYQTGSFSTDPQRNPIAFLSREPLRSLLQGRPTKIRHHCTTPYLKMLPLNVIRTLSESVRNGAAQGSLMGYKLDPGDCSCLLFIPDHYIFLTVKKLLLLWKQSWLFSVCNVVVKTLWNICGLRFSEQH